VPDDSARLDQDCFEAFNIQVQGLMRRLKSTGSKKIVIGVSGGLDSTQALLVACRAFDRLEMPRTDILAYTMPGFATSEGTKSNAWKLMIALGVHGHELDIRPAAEQMLKDIGHPFADGQPVHDITFENVQAGLRTDYLFRLANQNHGFVLGTGDLSELALGWATYGVGDHMSHYNVNGGVAKTLIRHLIRWVADKEHDGEAAEVLHAILATEISPELVPAGADGKIQSTEATVGPYALNDFFLFYITRFGLKPSKVAYLAHQAWGDAAKGDWPAHHPDADRVPYDLPTIKSWLRKFLIRFFQTSQFKRSALPNGPKVVTGGSLSPARRLARAVGRNGAGLARRAGRERSGLNDQRHHRARQAGVAEGGVDGLQRLVGVRDARGVRIARSLGVSGGFGLHGLKLGQQLFDRGGELGIFTRAFGLAGLFSAAGRLGRHGRAVGIFRRRAGRRIGIGVGRGRGVRDVRGLDGRDCLPAGRGGCGRIGADAGVRPGPAVGLHDRSQFAGQLGDQLADRLGVGGHRHLQHLDAGLELLGLLLGDGLALFRGLVLTHGQGLDGGLRGADLLLVAARDRRQGRAGRHCSGRGDDRVHGGGGSGDLPDPASVRYLRAMTDAPTKDSNGNLLAEGDSVTLIKDLKVKGSGGVTLKRGTMVRNIRLTDDPAEIEANVEKVRGLVLRTEFVRKA
jgi:NAD+ synthetase